MTATRASKVLVTGAGGFIGHHLVSFLKARGYWVRGVDLKAPEYAPSAADEFQLLDLRRWPDCLEATRDRKSTRLNSSHPRLSRMPSSA